MPAVASPALSNRRVNDPMLSRSPRSTVSRGDESLDDFADLSDANDLPTPRHDYIYNAAFASLTDDEVFGNEPVDSPIELDAALAEGRAGRDMPAYLLRLCEARLLKPAEEKQLFQRFNFARYRAAQLREKLQKRRSAASVAKKLEEMELRATSDRNRLVQSNLRLVVSIAKKFADLRNPFEELLSEGISTLIRAVEKFDYDRGFRFSTYATQAVRRTLCRLVSQRHAERSRFVASEADSFEQQPVENEAGTMTEARWDQLQTALLKMLGQLDPRERMIIQHRFGLDDSREVTTLQSLARQLGVCKERVRQLEQRAIIKLRQMADQVELSPEMNDS